MTDWSDVDVDGLAGGLDGTARIAREQLVAWLVERGFSADQIRESATLRSYRLRDGSVTTAGSFQPEKSPNRPESTLSCCSVYRTQLVCHE
jgi:hypothetical protein